MKGGALKSGGVKGGALKSGAMKGGAMNGGALMSGARKGGASKSGGVKGGPPKCGAVKGGALKSGAMKGDAVMSGAMKGGALMSGAMKGGALKSGALKGSRRVEGQCSRFPERLGAVTAAATGRGRAAGPRRPHRGAVRIGRPAMAQLARAAGWGSLIWVVNDFPNGYGALTGRPGRAASVRHPGGFSGVSPERPRARVAAAIAHLGRAEGTGRSVRTPCPPRAVAGGGSNCTPLGRGG